MWDNIPWTETFLNIKFSELWGSYSSEWRNKIQLHRDICKQLPCTEGLNHICCSALVFKISNSHLFLFSIINILWTSLKKGKMRHQCVLSYTNYPRLSIASSLSACAWGSDILTGATADVVVQNISVSSSFHIFVPSKSLGTTWTFGNAGEERQVLSFWIRDFGRDTPVTIQANIKQEKSKEIHNLLYGQIHTLLKWKLLLEIVFLTHFGVCAGTDILICVIPKGKFSMPWNNTSKVLLDFELFSWS